LRGVFNQKSSKLARYHPIIPFKHWKEIIEQATKSTIKEYGRGEYHLIDKNCQHFAKLCVYGLNISEDEQVNRDKWYRRFIYSRGKKLTKLALEREIKRSKEMLGLNSQENEEINKREEKIRECVSNLRDIFEKWIAELRDEVEQTQKKEETEKIEKILISLSCLENYPNQLISSISSLKEIKKLLFIDLEKNKENFSQFQDDFNYLKENVTVWRDTIESSELFKKLEEIRETSERTGKTFFSEEEIRTHLEIVMPPKYHNKIN
jgi:hypothetical protein